MYCIINSTQKAFLRITIKLIEKHIFKPHLIGQKVKKSEACLHPFFSLLMMPYPFTPLLSGPHPILTHYT